jgi:hypothetical protein
MNNDSGMEWDPNRDAIYHLTRAGFRLMSSGQWVNVDPSYEPTDEDRCAIEYLSKRRDAKEPPGCESKTT